MVPAHTMQLQTPVPVSGTLTISTMPTVFPPTKAQVLVSGTATLHVNPSFYTGPFAGTVILNIRSAMSLSGTATLDIMNTELSAKATFEIKNEVAGPLKGEIRFKYTGITGPLLGTATLNSSTYMPEHFSCKATLDIGNMEPFKFFTHCTSIEKRQSIECMGYLRRNRTKITSDNWDQPLAGPNAPMGVWFAVTLWDGILPDRSPFGTERVLVPMERIEKHVQSSLKPVLYFEAKIKNTPKPYIYIRLILLRGDDQAAIKWCTKHNLEQLDIHNNQWLCFDMCGQWITWKYHSPPPLYWVYIFIADNVCIEGCEWDNVTCTRYCRKCGDQSHWAPNCPN